MSVPRASCCAWAGPSRVMGDQMLFCAAVDASVTVPSLDVVVRTVTALCNWCSPLHVTKDDVGGFAALHKRDKYNEATYVIPTV